MLHFFVCENEVIFQFLSLCMAFIDDKMNGLFSIMVNGQKVTRLVEG